MNELKSLHIIILILGVLVIIFELFFTNDESQENSLTTGPNILIAIISARSNFAQRRELRKSWIQTLKEYKNVKYKFFVGKKCDVHPLDRLDKLSCSDLDEPFPNDTADNSITDSISLEKNLLCNNQNSSSNVLPNSLSCYSGFGFRVLHPLKFQSIGIKLKLLLEHESVSIVFKDAEEVFETIPVDLKSCSRIANGFCFVDLEEKFILPKDFEGMIALSDISDSNSNNEVCQFKCDGSFQFTFGILENQFEKYQDEMCTNVVANFTLEDKEAWDKHLNLRVKRQKEWQEEEDETDNELYLEMKSYDDVIYFHNVIDVYRNLPVKVLEMFKWGHTNNPSSFVLKVDDDVDVDIPVLLNWASEELKGQNGLGIWAHFYHQRSVPMFGKWADFEYQGITYPSFPSGSGYLLSDRLVYLLTMQSPFLRPFQGEDISIGIWTQVLRLGQDVVKKNHVNCWLPAVGCNHSIILPYIMPSDINIDR